MKAQDLRIGNLVYAPNKKDILQISRDMFSYERGLTNLEDLEPIELTEEWLLRMGFEIADDSYSSNRIHNSTFKEALLGENPITKDYLLVLKNTGNGWFYKNGHFRINTVNQLQNLIHALTGEELTIK